VTLEFKDLFNDVSRTFLLGVRESVVSFPQQSPGQRKLNFVRSESQETTGGMHFTKFSKVQISSLPVPVPNKNFPKPIKQISVLFKDFQQLP